MLRPAITLPRSPFLRERAGVRVSSSSDLSPGSVQYRFRNSIRILEDVIVRHAQDTHTM